jgi:beta-glucoside kinase
MLQRALFYRGWGESGRKGGEDGMKKYIVFDVGGTKVKHGLIGEDGRFLEKSAYPTEREDLDRFVADMVEAIRRYRDAHAVEGIAISLPGYINIDTGYSEKAGAVTALHKKNLKEILEERVHLPVEIENDGNCAAIAEKVSGNAQDCDDFICMTIGTGIGGGIYLNGDIYRGRRFMAGEYGMMITYLDGGTMRNMHETSGTASLVFQYRQLKNLQEPVEGEKIFAEAKTDPDVKALLDRWIGHIARGVYNLVVTLNPEKMLIGGGVSAQPYLIEEINRQLEGYEFWEDFKIPVVPCKYRNDAGMLGAFYHFQKMRRIRQENR